MNLLVHICCGPCLAYTQKALREEGHELKGFFFNPNIQPYGEFRGRLGALKTYAQDNKISVAYQDDYGRETLNAFLHSALSAKTPEERCLNCYRMRLNRTAEVAEGLEMDAFTTTLLYSIHQKHDLIKQAGEEAAKRYELKFYYKDFRLGYNEGRAIWKQTGLYSQKYCGCVFSEMEAHLKKGQDVIKHKDGTWMPE